MKLNRILILVWVLLMGLSKEVSSQGTSCATATLLPTTATNSCATFTTTAATGGSVCVGGGFGGSGYLSWFRICTDANASCIELNLTPGTLTGAYSYALYSTCTGNTAGGFVAGQQGANNCYGSGGPSTWRTTGLNLAPNTCYYLAVWTKNQGTFQICSKKIPAPPNDECAGATQITAAPTPSNNFCYTPNVSDPAPSTFCAASDENSAWFVFTAQCNGSVTLTISSIVCTGGAGGFQIGFYTGSCNNLTNIGCNSGSGGTVTTTVTNLTAGQTVYILIDGNAGSQCTFNVAASNTTPAISPPVTICQGQSVTLTAFGGTTYSWSPGGQTTSSITVSPTSTTTYSAAINNCASTTLSTTVTVNQNVTPTFNPVGTICPGGSFTLPTTSTNGITGTWSPAINNQATTTYTFTPDTGQCATTATMTVTVSAGTIPTFTPVSAICRGGNFTLPTTSNNGITGNWSPAINNQATTTYTFTPAAGQCALTATMTVTVNVPVNPTFNSIPAICAGGSFTLQGTSNNGIAGTWLPAINNQATTTYTFTPAAGQCANTATLTVTVNQPVNPTFNSIPAICAGGSFTLPGTSNNGVTGSWSPSINNQATTIYTFTPTAGLCANTATLTVTVNPLVTPNFNQVGPVCAGASFSLPATSTNGITGTWSPNINNQSTTTYTFTPSAASCGISTSMTVTVNPSVTPTFNPVAPICRGGSFTLPQTSNNGINGAWSPAINNQSTTTYTFTPTPTAGVCATTTTLTVTVNQPVTPTFTAVQPICNGGNFTLPGTSNNGITGAWSPAINNTVTTTYTFTPAAGQCANTATLTVTVNQPVTPTFNQISPICLGGNFSFTNTSNNGINGSWSPTINNQATTVYTFTPVAGSCANTTTMQVVVNNPVTPTFNTVGPVCSGSSFTLPTNSTNGFSGSWSPVINNQATTTYTFTPGNGQCATTTTMSVVVNPSITPTFDPIPAICRGGTFSLPSTSTNSISGSWSPALNNQSTTTYTFTAGPGVCATTASLTVTVNVPATPIFTQVSAICRGGSFTLPSTSNNNISGTWSPAINNQSTTTYTFTPAQGICATTATMTVNVNAPTNPNFNQVSAICQGGSFTLPSTSNNNISGSWSPAINNQATTTYTFTPNQGVCANTTTMQVVVNTPVTPSFNTPGPYCIGTNFTLPSTSTNNVSGSWSPAVNNQATTTYTFTPGAGQCATTATMTVTINSRTTPTFTPINAICSGGTLTLPTTSTNGYTGTWSPAVNNQATTTYTFTPSAGQCATTTTMTVNVSTNITPAFNQLGPVCSGAAAPSLSPTSLNGITGIWSPSVVSNVSTGTYVFTPNAGQCASNTVSMVIQVINPVTPQFPVIGPFCSGQIFTLPDSSLNGIQGSWSPAVNNTVTTPYLFTPAAGECAITGTITVVVNNPVVPAFSQIGSVCAGNSFTLPSGSTNGVSGSWSPAVNNSLTTTYTFTPSTGACATAAQMTVSVYQPVIPIFDPVDSVCSGASFSLPGLSINGVSGVWSPAINNSITTTYTFTPSFGNYYSCSGGIQALDGSPRYFRYATVYDWDCCLFSAGIYEGPSYLVDGHYKIEYDCAGVGTVIESTGGYAISYPVGTIYSNNFGFSTNPTFKSLITDPNCCNADGSKIFVELSGERFQYGGQCASSSAMTVVIIQPDTPSFNVVGPICRGGNFQLISSSIEGINGTWSPAINNQATTTYTFTPAAGVCATTSTITVNVNQPVQPAFSPIAPVCSGTNFTLPAASDNGFTGSWTPALSNTQTTAYTFTPDAGQCATTANLTVTVNQRILPVFPSYGPFCQNSILAQVMLPSLSNNGISGVWNPGMLSTAVAGNISYAFTPDSNECALPYNMIVAVDSELTPSFAVIAPICQGGSISLPPSSLNNISGSWSPAVNNNITTTYTFTPANGQCAVSDTLTVTVNPNITPSFDAVGPLCSGTPLAALPNTSNNGISGGWSPAINNTQTTQYTFTPAPNQCTTGPVNLTINIDQPALPAFNPISPICEGQSFSLPASSTQGITGSWTPAINNTQTTNYTFVPDSGQCASNGNLTVTVNGLPATPNLNLQQPTCSTVSVLTIANVAGVLFSVDNGQFSSVLTYNGLATGNHMVIAQNAAGCVSDSSTVFVNAAPGAPSAPQVIAVQPDCFVPTGILQIAALPGESYSVAGGAYSSVLTYDSLAPGNYAVVAQNASGCISPATNILINPAPAIPSQPVLNATQPDCSNSIALIQIVGVPGEAYSFDNAAFSSVLTYDSLTPGNHTVVAQNTAGCLSPSATVNILPAPSIPAAPIVNAAQPNCLVPSGSLSIAGVSGENYSVNGAPYDPSLTYSGLAPGSYSVVAQNAAGCISSSTQVQINQLGAPPASPNANPIQPDCFTTTGTIQLVAVPGQTYNLNGGAFSSNATFTSLAPGTYSIITQTDTGCFSAPTVIVIDPPPSIPSVPALTTNQPSCSLSTGSILIAGVTGETYSFNGGAFSSTLNYPALTAGNYTIVAENASGCRSTAAAAIINPAPLVPAVPVLSAVQPSCTVASVISISGQAGVLFSLDGGPFSSSLQYSPVSTGSHTIVAQSADGCTSSANTFINPVPGAPAAPVVNITQPGCNETAGSAVIIPVSNLSYSFNGSPYSNTLNYGSLSPGNYTVTAKDTAGCVSSPALITINPPPAIPPAPVVNSPVRVCQYTSGIPLSATGSGTLQWYAAASGGVASGSAPVPSTSGLGVSYYYVSQIIGPCEGPRAMIMVRVEPKPVLDIDRDIRLCFGKSLDLTSLYNTSDLSAQWFLNSLPVTNPVSVNTAGSYQLIAANGAGCADTARVLLTIQPALTANAGPDDTAEFYRPYRLNGSGGGSYLWTPGSPILNNAGIPNPTALLTETTQFILEVRDPIGCNDLDTVVIYVRLGEDFSVPNAFSPNGDGLNDYFSPVPQGGIASLDYFAVYNRFGNLVFQTSDITRRWDGTYAGRPQNPGNFVWVLKGKNRRGESKFLKGNVVLIR